MLLSWVPCGPGPLCCGLLVFPCIPFSPLGQCVGGCLGGLVGVVGYIVLIASDLFFAYLSCCGGLVSGLGAVTGEVFRCCSDIINCCGTVF